MRLLYKSGRMYCVKNCGSRQQQYITQKERSLIIWKRFTTLLAQKDDKDGVSPSGEEGKH